MVMVIYPVNKDKQNGDVWTELYMYALLYNKFISEKPNR